MRRWPCDAQAQKQLLNFDEGHMSGTVGLPRMEWLRVLKRDDNGPAKLGHGKQFLKYKLTKNPRRLRKGMQMLKNVSVGTIQVELNASPVIF